MTVGSDAFEAAPVLPVGTASDWTPNSSYTMQPGEPGGSAGRTAWWKFTPTEAGVHYIDALHSRLADGTLAPTWLWIYKLVGGTGLASLVEQTWTGNRVQIDVTPGTTYYVQVDARQSDSQVWYSLAVGAHPSAEIVQRYGLGGPWIPTQETIPPGAVVDHHFTGSETTGGVPGTVGEDWNNHVRGLLEAAAILMGGTTVNKGVVHGYVVNDNDALDQETDATYAQLAASAFYNSVTTDYPDFWEGNAHPGPPPTLQLRTSSAYRDEILTPPGYSVLDAKFVVRARVENPSGQTIPVNTDPATLDRGEIVVFAGHSSDGVNLGNVSSDTGDLYVTSAFQDFILDRPPGSSSDQIVDYYNGVGLVIFIAPGYWQRSIPEGDWYFSYVGLQVTFASTGEYFPPDPPPFPRAFVTRLYPRDDGRGLSSAPRIHPPTKARRIVGGYQ